MGGIGMPLAEVCLVLYGIRVPSTESEVRFNNVLATFADCPFLTEIWKELAPHFSKTPALAPQHDLPSLVWPG